MHPHVAFFDKLASSMDAKDPRIARVLCGIRDQIDAAVKANAAGRVKMGNRKSLLSVLRSVSDLIDKHGDEHPNLRKLLAHFVQKVNQNRSLT